MRHRASRCPFVALALGEPWPVIVFAAIAAVAVIVLHRPNIRRLRAGTESRFHFAPQRRARVAPSRASQSARRRVAACRPAPPRELGAELADRP